MGRTWELLDSHESFLTSQRRDKPEQRKREKKKTTTVIAHPGAQRSKPTRQPKGIVAIRERRRAHGAHATRCGSAKRCQLSGLWYQAFAGPAAEPGCRWCSGGACDILRGLLTAVTLDGSWVCIETRITSGGPKAEGRHWDWNLFPSEDRAWEDSRVHQKKVCLFRSGLLTFVMAEWCELFSSPAVGTRHPLQNRAG